MVQNDEKEHRKKVSIVMMSTFSGSSFKAPQLASIIHYLSRENLLAASFGIPENSDYKEYKQDELAFLKRSELMKLIMRVSDKLMKAVGIKNSYLLRERIFGFFARHFFKADGDIVLVKPRPASLARYYKKLGKTVVVEASELHTEYTYSRIKSECESLSISLVKSNYTNKMAIEDFAQGVSFADRLICLSNYSKQTYIERGIAPDRIWVTGLTTGMKMISSRDTRDGEIVFVSVANHSILKGTLRLLRIWKKYGIVNKLMIVGHIHSDLIPYIDEYMAIENIIFTGSLKREDIEKIYLKSRCVGVLLSVSEGFSRTVLECLSTATPVIVTETCTCDVVEDGKNGFIVRSEDEEQVYKRIMDYNKMTSERYALMSKEAYAGAINAEKDFVLRYVGAIIGEKQK